MLDSPVNTLVLMKWPTNVGYAIGRLESVFFDVALRMAQGEASRIRYVYPEVGAGLPEWRPSSFDQVDRHDIMDTSRGNLRRLEELARRHRVDFALTFDMQPTHPMYLALRRAGARGIVSYWGAPISGINPAWKRFIKRAMLKVARSKVDGLVFESAAMADLALRGRGVPMAMTDIVPLGVDVAEYHPQPSNYAHDALDIPRDRRIVVYSGHCTRRKGIHVLVDAAVNLLTQRGRKDVCFLICGNKDQESERFENVYKGLDIARWIKFVGYRRDLARIYQSSYCGVIPSVDWDSYTLSSVEMAATGLPVIVSRLQGLAESVVDRQTGLHFEPGDSHALAERITELLDNPSLSARLGESARRRCVREFTVEKQCERLYQAFSRRLT